MLETCLNLLKEAEILSLLREFGREDERGYVGGTKVLVFVDVEEEAK